MEESSKTLDQSEEEPKIYSQNAEQMLIGSQIAFVQKEQPCGVVKCDFYTVKHQDRIYEIIANYAKIQDLIVVADPQKKEIKEKEVNSILATIKFTK